jgi:HlyD family secretion protein
VHWRLQEALAQQGPRVVTLGSLVAMGWLLVQGPISGVPGYAEVEPVRVAALEAGRITEVLVAPGDVVEPQQVLGRLDDAAVQATIRMREAELRRRGAALQDEERSAQSQLRAAVADEEDARAQLAGARAQLRLARERRDERKRQVEAGLADQASLSRLESTVAEHVTEVERLSARVANLRGQTQAARSAVEGDEAPAVQEEAQARAVVREELSLLEYRLGSMTLRAPLAGRVSALHARPGEVLPAHAPLLELVPLETSVVVACLPEQLSDEVRAGTAAELRPSSGGVRSGVVVDVAGLVSQATERCKQRPNETGWVRPVRIAVSGGGLVPGQRFEVVFGPGPQEAS